MTAPAPGGEPLTEVQLRKLCELVVANLLRLGWSRAIACANYVAVRVSHAGGLKLSDLQALIADVDERVRAERARAGRYPP